MTPPTAKPSYLGAFLRHPINRVSLLAAGCASIFASIPYGWNGLALVGILALGTELLAALMVPSLPPFKAAVDREQRMAERATRQQQLMARLGTDTKGKDLAAYHHMVARVQDLYRMAGAHQNGLSGADVEKLEDLTLDYLGLCVTDRLLRQHKDVSNAAVFAQRIAVLEQQLRTPGLADDELRQLRTAHAEYAAGQQRARRLAARRSALEATLVSMPDKMEEVYQMVLTAPYASDTGQKLEESLQRLRIAEEVAAEFDPAVYAELESAPVAASPTSSAQPGSRNLGAQQRARQGMKT